MEPSRLRPFAQVFVCTNVRAGTDPLRSACGAAGPAVFVAARNAVGNAGRVRDVWVTRTACLGHCPQRGCAVAIHPGNEQWIDVTEPDAVAVAQRAIAMADRVKRGE